MVCGCRKIDGAVGSGGRGRRPPAGIDCVDTARGQSWTELWTRRLKSCRDHKSVTPCDCAVTVENKWTLFLQRCLCVSQVLCRVLLIFFAKMPKKSQKTPLKMKKKNFFCCFYNVWSNMNIKIINNTILRSLTVQKDNCEVYICLRMCKKTKQTTFVLLSLW